MADHAPADDGTSGDLGFHRLRDSPCHGRDALGHAADDFALEVFDDLRAPFGEPRRRARHAPAVRERQRIGEIRERIGERFVVVRVIGRLLVAARAWTKRPDAELFHHVPMVVGRRPFTILGGGRLRVGSLAAAVSGERTA